jgi:hypothetical protein
LKIPLGIFLGFAHYRVRRATLAGVAFVLPSFLMEVALGWAYVRYGGLAWMQAVLKSLRGAGIHVVAIHQHMTGEEPRLIFLHYWGQGKAQELAKSVRAAIDLTATKTGGDSSARR